MDKEDSNEGGGDGVQPEKSKDTEAKDEVTETKEFLDWVAGNKVLEGSVPMAHRQEELKFYRIKNNLIQVRGLPVWLLG